MDIMKLIADKLDDSSVIKNLNSSIDADSNSVRQAAKLSIPAMIKGLQENAQTDHGEKDLEKALDRHKDDEVDDMSNFLSGVDKSEGERVLSHMFGERRGRVETNIAKETGLDVSQVTQIMQQLAPLVLGFLGKKNKEKNGGVSELLNGILEGDHGLMGLASKLLGKDSDGTIPTEIGDILGGLFKRKD